MNRALTTATLVAFALCVLPLHASAQDGSNVLVVANAANADSIRIAEYYAGKRGVPADQLLRLTSLPPDPADGIDRLDFDRDIHAPIAAWLGRHQAQDRILFIVLTKGVPLRINGPRGENTAASVDSELTLLYERLVGMTPELEGPLPNPLFLGDGPLAKIERFSREQSRLYLVTRLDGYTVDDVIGLIDRASAPSTDGRFILDGKRSLTDKGNQWLKAAAERLTSTGLSADRVVFDDTARVVADQIDVLGYYSWGSNDPFIRRRDFNLTFRNGAIGGMFVSTDGRTFREPPEGWTLPSWANKEAWFAGSPQSLAGDLIRAGITGVAGHVAEPRLGNAIRPDILFPAYFAGLTLAEAYYRAMPSLSWMTVVVGDPLCKPFGGPPTRLADPPLDPETELPATFSERRLARVGENVPLAARKALLRAESRTARGDAEGARADLERATHLAPSLTGAQFILASQDEARGAFDEAIARYRTILEFAPDSPLALNNLAYTLGVHKADLRQALPLARRAYQLAPNSGHIADTLGWLSLMSGDGKQALELLTRAAAMSPRVAEIRFHLAQVHAALGNAESARTEMDQAVKLQPSMKERPEARAILEK